MDKIAIETLKDLITKIETEQIELKEVGIKGKHGEVQTFTIVYERKELK